MIESKSLVDIFNKLIVSYSDKNITLEKILCWILWWNKCSLRLGESWLGEALVFSKQLSKSIIWVNNHLL